MAEDMVLLRKTDGSGAGYEFTRSDAKKFLKENPDYVEEGAEETAANQRAADEAVAAEQAAKAKRAARTQAG